MNALGARGIRIVFGVAAALSTACGADNGQSPTSQSGTGGFAFGGFAAFAGVATTGGFGGSASGAGFVGAGGIIASGGFVASGGFPGGGGTPPPGTGGVVVDPGPEPKGQILDCRGTGPCLIDDGDACCIGASTDSSGNVTSVSENCIPPTASCTYPLSIAHCDGPEDCRTTEVCCGTLKPYGKVPLFGDLACQPAGECTGNQKFVVCRQGITVCPGSTTCGTFPTLPPDILVCR